MEEMEVNKGRSSIFITSSLLLRFEVILPEELWLIIFFYIVDDETQMDFLVQKVLRNTSTFLESAKELILFPMLFVCRHLNKIVKKFIEKWNIEVIELIFAFLGSKELLKWSQMFKKPFYDQHTFAMGIYSGKIDVLEYLLESSVYIKETICFCDAAKAGNLDILIWLRTKRNFSWNKSACMSAAKYGHLEVLKYLKENNCLLDLEICYVAAKFGHLEIMKYLKEINCPWDAGVCAIAAAGGHLEVLKFLKENNCPWNEIACTKAASCGHFEVLKYLRENNCPWNENTFTATSKSLHLEIFKYLIENNCPMEENTNPIVQIKLMEMRILYFGQYPNLTL